MFVLTTIIYFTHFSRGVTYVTICQQRGDNEDVSCNLMQLATPSLDLGMIWGLSRKIAIRDRGSNYCCVKSAYSYLYCKVLSMNT